MLCAHTDLSKFSASLVFRPRASMQNPKVAHCFYTGQWCWSIHILQTSSALMPTSTQKQRNELSKGIMCVREAKVLNHAMQGYSRTTVGDHWCRDYYKTCSFVRSPTCTSWERETRVKPRHGHTQVETHRKRRRADAETDSDRRWCLNWRSRASEAHMAVYSVWWRAQRARISGSPRNWAAEQSSRICFLPRVHGGNGTQIMLNRNRIDEPVQNRLRGFWA